jgi:hypothetical protein
MRGGDVPDGTGQKTIWSVFDLDGMISSIKIIEDK